MMKREILITKDGSPTIEIAEMNVTYHSIHGAVQESSHIFIQTGLLPLIELKQFEIINIFEMGLGTGLNAMLTYEAANKFQQKIKYNAIELFPLQEKEYTLLNYAGKEIILQLHQSKWDTDIVFNRYFSFHKTNQSLLGFSTDSPFNLIYYDAFAPAAQPELWTEAVFSQLYSWLVPNAVLVTYCSKSTVQKTMKAAGFTIEKIPGPPGKREIIRATKPNK